MINDITSFAPGYGRTERRLSREAARRVAISLGGRCRAMGIAPSADRRREEEGDGGVVENTREREKEGADIRVNFMRARGTVSRRAVPNLERS